jgi:hypothetical protein
VDDLLGIHPHGVHPPLAGHRRQQPIFGMRAVQVIRHPSAQPSNSIPARTTLPEGRSRFSVCGKCSGSSTCICRGTSNPSSGRRCPQSNQAFAAFEHGPTSQGLQTIQVGQSRRIGFFSPIPPEAGSAHETLLVLAMDCGLMPVPTALATKASMPALAQGLRRTRSRDLVRSSARASEHRADCTRDLGASTPSPVGPDRPLHAPDGRTQFFDPVHQNPLSVVTRIWRVIGLPRPARTHRRRPDSTASIAAFRSATLNGIPPLLPSKVTRCSPLASGRAEPPVADGVSTSSATQPVAANQAAGLPGCQSS